MIQKIFVGICLLLLLAGCQSLSERRQSVSLQEVLRNYEGVLRWGAIEQAARFFDPESERPDVAKPAAPMRVTHYEVVQGPTKVEDDKAIQTAVIQYVFIESQVVREVVDQQTWQYDRESERWYLISPLPEFK